MNHHAETVPQSELAESFGSERQPMAEAPVKLLQGHAIPNRSNSELAQLFEQEDIIHLIDVYCGR